MIITTYDRLADYSEIPFVKDIQKFIDEFSKTEMKSGRYDIHGDDLFAAVSRYDTEPREQKEFENHKKYIDLQMVLDGEEELDWAPVGNLTITKDGFSDGGDISFYSGNELSTVVLGGKQCAILFEDDAHKPGVVHKKAMNVLKIVFKIKCDA